MQLETSGCDLNGECVLMGKMAADQVMVSDAQVDGNILMPNRCWGDGRESILRIGAGASGMLRTLASQASRNQKKRGKSHRLLSNSGSKKITGIPY